MANLLGNRSTGLIEPFEVFVVQVFINFSLAKFVLAARLRHKRNVSVLRQGIAERLSDENLARRIRKMLNRSHDMSDFEVMVIDHCRQVIQTRSVGSLDHMILLARPIEIDFASNQIVDLANAITRHLQPDDTFSILRFKRCGLLIRFRHPLAAVNKLSFLFFSRLALRRDFRRCGIVAIGVARFEQLFHRRLVFIQSLRLKIGRMRAIDFRAFIPINPQPAEPVKDRLQCLGDVTLSVGVINPQNKLAARLARQQPVEQSRADTPDMEVTSRAGSESSADRHGSVLVEQLKQIALCENEGF